MTGSDKKKKLSHRNVLKYSLWMFGKVRKYTPGYLVWMFAEGIIWGINHSVQIIYIQKLFDALGARAGFDTVAHIILCYAVYFIVFQLFHNWYWEIYNPKVREKLHIAMHSDMFGKAVSIDLAKYDDPKFYNDFVFSMDKSFAHATGLMEDTGKLINRLVASVTLTGVLLSVDKTMAIMIFALAIVRIFLTLAFNKIQLKYTDEMNPLDRKEQYIKRVFKLPDYAKELRITSVFRNLFEEHNKNTDEKKKLVVKYGLRLALILHANTMVGIILESGLMVLMLYKVMVTHEVELGAFAVAVNACWKMSMLLRDLVNRLMKYHEHAIFIEKMATFMSCQPTITDGSLVAEPFESLTIKNVSFSYTADSADTDKAANDTQSEKSSVCALDGVDMEIRRGEKIAIVGYNGAGKTTLTKLIMRLYEPEKGDILYNGKSLRSYTVASLRQRIAAVFQDYRIFAGSLAENVVGGMCTQACEQKVCTALEKSTFGDKLHSLPMGLSTQLTREFDDDGTQLSGGEQQKVAIARAFYKDADLIILAEPSAALDPDAEYELNKSIAEYAENRAVIFISHRLSTTRHADRIYMFAGGKLIESGSHDELIAKGGKYAYMFNLQAEKYRESDNENVA